jgi:uncharacterized protein
MHYVGSDDSTLGPSWAAGRCLLPGVYNRPAVSVTAFLLVAVAGLLAGVINSIAGAGSLITFPALLAVGLPPLRANVSNSVGLVPGSISGAWGYRAELRGHLRELALLAIPSAIGGIIGAVLLLQLPPQVFEVVVPLLVASASVLVLVQPWIARHLAVRVHNFRAALASLLVVGVYAGYFGAAQGIMLLAVMGLSLDAPLVRINGYKTVVAGVSNAASGVIFFFFASISWPHAVVLAVSSLVGGSLGAALGRRLPEAPLRVGIAIFGLVVAARLALNVRL